MRGKSCSISTAKVKSAGKTKPEPHQTGMSYDKSKGDKKGKMPAFLMKPAKGGAKAPAKGAKKMAKKPAK
jgi:hypothetical protein